jgi:hypothetical protein
MKLEKWLYADGRPNRMAAVLNALSAAVYSLGVAPNYLVTLEVPGRSSGRLIKFPLVMTALEGERYLVSMLGEKVNWVRNVRAAGGLATLRHGRREPVQLEVVAVEQRPAILRAYLQRAPGARAHFPIDKNAPNSEFERIAADFPVFRIVSREVAGSIRGI